MKKSLNNPKIALVYDRVNKFGGAERLLLSLHQAFPDAPLYTLVYNQKTATWAKNFKVKPTFLNLLPFFRTHHEFLAPMSALAFETLNLNSFDVVISVTSSDAKAVVTKPSTLHICYCLTPTRYLWSGRRAYQRITGFGHFSPLVSYILKKLKKYFQSLDLATSSRPDHYLAISKEVQNRIHKYYHRPSDLIYPPLNPVFYNLPLVKKEDYYLVVSRLVGYKRVDLAVKACIKLNKRLIVVGTGNQVSKLKKISLNFPNITFVGSVDDQALINIYQKAKAFIFPGFEDFGLTPLEAQACGTPVIAYGCGGVLETVIPGQTGIFFKKQSVSSLVKAIQGFEASASKYKPSACQANAMKFTENRFIQEFHDKVNSLWKKRLNTHT